MFILIQYGKLALYKRFILLICSGIQNIQCMKILADILL
jgi:hypothetical protein